MIKIIGAIFLIGGATLLGLSASVNLTIRAKSLKGFLSALQIMHSEIGERLTPIDELMELLSAEVSAPVSMLFESCLQEMREKSDVPFCLIWRKQIKTAEYLRLSSAEAEELASLGNILGRYGAEEQKRAIEHIIRCVESMHFVAEGERKKLGSLYTKLGLICGIAVVIVFI